MKQRTNLTAKLEVVFALAPRALGVLLLATVAVATLPLLVIALAVATVAALAVAAWREIVPPHRAARNYAALAELWSALVAFDRRSRRDFNRLVHTGNWSEFVGETPRPVSRPAPTPLAVETVETPVTPVVAPAPGPLPLVLAVRTLPLLAYRPAPVLSVDAGRTLSRQSMPTVPSMADVLSLHTAPADAWTVEPLPIVAVLPAAPATAPKRTRKPSTPRKPRVAATPKVKPAPAPKPTAKPSRRTAPLDAALEVIQEAKRVRTMPSAARCTAPSMSMSDVLRLDAMPADAFTVDPLAYDATPLPGAPVPTAKPKRARRTAKPDAVPAVLKKIRPWTPAQLVGYLQKDLHKGCKYLATARDYGILTDGKWLMLATDAHKAKLPQIDAGIKPIGHAMIDDLLKTKHRCDAATFGTQAGEGTDRTVSLTHGKDTVHVSARAAALLLKTYKGATLHLASRKPGESPVVVRHDGRVVGLIMPRNASD